VPALDHMKEMQSLHATQAHGQRPKLTVNTLAALTLLPAVVLFFCITVIPLAWAIHASLYQINPFSPEWRFVGLRNFLFLMQSAEFWHTTWRSIVFGAGSTLLQLMLGVGVALVLNRPFRGIAMVRAMAFAGYLLPPIVIALSFRWMGLSQNGVFNDILLRLQVIAQPIAFFGDERYAMPSLIAIAAWQYTGFVALMVLARLQGIPDRLYEAARIDGAGPLRQFIDVTLPQIKGIIVVVLLLRFVWMFNKFDLIYIATRGGPGNSTQTLPLYIFDTAFTRYQLGTAAAVAVLLFIQLLIVAVVFFYVTRHDDETVTR
jgi:multiple sugar transport system permease protein